MLSRASAGGKEPLKRSLSVDHADAPGNGAFVAAAAAARNEKNKKRITGGSRKKKEMLPWMVAAERIDLEDDDDGVKSYSSGSAFSSEADDDLIDHGWVYDLVAGERPKGLHGSLHVLSVPACSAFSVLLLGLK